MRTGYMVVRTGHIVVRTAYTVVRTGHTTTRTGHMVVRTGHTVVRTGHTYRIVFNAQIVSSLIERVIPPMKSVHLSGVVTYLSGGRGKYHGV